MATLDQRRPQNVKGDVYVDETCIDCDTCRWMAPNVFHRADGQSAVYHQPTNETERLAAMQALLSCPTASIGTVDKPQDIKDDITAKTRDVELQLTGNDAIALSPDLLIIPVPGHTKGHTVLLYQQRFLFTGDHLAWSDHLHQLYAFRRVCWYSWSELLNSMRRLATYSFEWVLPGHGRRYHADKETMRQQMHKCINWMETVR